MRAQIGRKLITLDADYFNSNITYQVKIAEAIAFLKID